LFERGKEAYKVEEQDRRELINLFSRGGSSRGYYEMQNGPSMMDFTNDKKIADTPSGTGKNQKLPGVDKLKEKIKGKLFLFPQSPAILEVSLGGIHVSASAGEVQAASSQPMQEERIRSQMEKLGNTPFEWENLEIEMGEQIFVPVKTLNEVRREAVSLLETELLAKNRRALPVPTESEPSQRNIPEIKNIPAKAPVPVYVSCESQQTARMLLTEEGIQGMYLPYEAMEVCLEAGIRQGLELYLALPHITRGSMPEGYLAQAKKWLSQGMKGFLVRNLEAYGMLKEAGLASCCVLDASMYTWNDEAVDFWEKEGVLRNTVPLELNEKEIAHRDNRHSEMLIYGYLPLMVSAQCVRKNLYGCNGREETLFIRDRYEKEFPVSCVCHPWKTKNTDGRTPCYNIIYNSLPYGLLKEKDRVLSLGISSIRLSFTIEEPKEALRILREFLGVYRDGKQPADENYTKGHFKRGAE
jgi:putative protease